MHFDIITIFPEFFAGPLDYGIVRRAREARLIEIAVRDLRDFTHDRHRTVDDRPFGGGEGMVLKPEPLFEAVESIAGTQDETRQRIRPSCFCSRVGKIFSAGMPRGDSQSSNRIVLLCGRYEGVDERVAEHLATDEISIGDFVLSGGELARRDDRRCRHAAAARRAWQRRFHRERILQRTDAESEEAQRGGVTQTVRQRRSRFLRRGAGSSRIAANSRGILDYPHYTRPQSFEIGTVPEILMSGNHEEIRRWRRRQALEKTLRNRPELLEAAAEESKRHNG